MRSPLSRYFRCERERQPKREQKSSDLVKLAQHALSASVIIQYEGAPTASDVMILQWLSGSTPVSLSSIISLQAKLPLAVLDLLETLPNVKYISVDRVLATRDSTPSVPSIATTAEYTAEPINAPAVWAKGYVGTGIGVAVIDSGINTVKDLSVDTSTVTAARAAWSTARALFPNETERDERCLRSRHPRCRPDRRQRPDSNGKKYTRTFLGIAPNVNLINLRVLDENGAGTDSQVIAAIEQAIALKNMYNIRSSTCRWAARSTRATRWIRSARPWSRRGRPASWWWWPPATTAATAALNSEGYGTIEAPGNDPYVMTVGAVNTEQHGHAERRRDGDLQLQGTVLHRPGRQARHRRSGQPGDQPASNRTTTCRRRTRPSTRR